MKNKYSVTLEPVTGGDYETISQWTSSKTWVYTSGIHSYSSPADLEMFFKRVDDRFLLVCADDGQAIGVVSWKETETPGNYVVGSMIGDPEMWGAGFGLESGILLLDMLFDSRNAHRVQFACGVFNRRAVENFCSGLIRIEGVLRDYYFIDGSYHDALVGSILRDEYYAAREPAEIVPAPEKEASRTILEEFLTKNPIALRTL
ncbi:GNAT family N-acetyltransferase [Streptomyces sp. NPDC059340]|uniref:GNAT family N-acetyltransferase n=1 Tax=Streptomyces sp. NPDC059340 TaxID=3346806 RepID=UPI00367B1C31